MEKEFTVWRPKNLAKINFVFHEFGCDPTKYKLVKYDKEMDEATFILADSKEAKRKSKALRKREHEFDKKFGKDKPAAREAYKKFIEENSHAQ